MTRRKWYAVVVLAIVASFGITLLAAQSAKKAENERAMLFELKQLRTAVQLYFSNNKKEIMGHFGREVQRDFLAG